MSADISGSMRWVNQGDDGYSFGSKGELVDFTARSSRGGKEEEIGFVELTWQFIGTESGGCRKHCCRS